MFFEICIRARIDARLKLGLTYRREVLVSSPEDDDFVGRIRWAIGTFISLTDLETAEYQATDTNSWRIGLNSVRESVV